MKNRAAPAGRPIEGRRIAEIAGHGLNVQLTNSAGRPDQSPHSVAAFHQFSGHVPADETGRSGNQRRLHSIKSYRNAQLISLSVSPNFALIPSAADGSYPQWTMQWSQRGSLPAP